MDRLDDMPLAELRDAIRRAEAELGPDCQTAQILWRVLARKLERGKASEKPQRRGRRRGAR